MNDLKKLDLKVEDFDLLVEGLDALPEKGVAADMMSHLLGGMLMSDMDEEVKAKHKLESEAKMRKREDENNLRKDQIKILQGKLLQLKQFMIENKLVSEAVEIIEK